MSKCHFQRFGFTMKMSVKIFVGLYFFLLLTYCHQKHFDSAVPASRLCLLHELCEHGRLDIGNSIRFTPDVAQANDKLFSDKAPGMAIAAFPGFSIAWLLSSVLNMEINKRLLFGSWLACATSSALVLAICANLFLSLLSKFIVPRLAFLLVTAIIFGAGAFPYATMLHSHALVIGLLTITMWTVCRDLKILDQVSSSHTKWDVLGGFCCGFALASEYTAGLVVVGIIIYLLVKGSRRRILYFTNGFIPPLLTIPLYSLLTLGNPLTLPYSHTQYFPEMNDGLYSIGWPNVTIALRLLVQPERGLLFWSPFLALAIFGYFDLFRYSRGLFLLTYTVPFLQIIIISGRAWDWPAGPSLQSRYLSPILPLLAIPCAYGFQRVPAVAAILTGYSILVTTLATLTDACPPFQPFGNPLLEYHLLLFLKSDLSPNLGVLLSLSPILSSALFYVVMIAGFIWLWFHLPLSDAQEKVATKTSVISLASCKE